MVLRRDNKESLNIYAKDLFLSKISDTRKAKGEVIVGLSAGNSVLGFYEELSKSDFNWQGTRFFLVDERFVGLDDKHSNYKFIMDTFGRQAEKKGAKFHAYFIKDGIKAYSSELLKHGGFDMIVLGVGEDGHTASLFPESEHLKSKEEGYIFIENSPKLPKKRISASPTLIKRSRIAFTFFIGDSKREALLGYLDNKKSFFECPVKIINQIKEHYEFTNLK